MTDKALLDTIIRDFQQNLSPIEIAMKHRISSDQIKALTKSLSKSDPSYPVAMGLLESMRLYLGSYPKDGGPTIPVEPEPEPEPEPESVYCVEGTYLLEYNSETETWVYDIEGETWELFDNGDGDWALMHSGDACSYSTTGWDGTGSEGFNPNGDCNSVTVSQGECPP